MYLGISAYNHESAAALMDINGNLVDYYREESLSRIKGDNSFPKRSIKKIIRNNSLSKEDIKLVAFYERPLSAFLFPLRTAAKEFPNSLPLMSHQLRNFSKSSLTCFSDLSAIYEGLGKKLVYLDHHLSHTLTALAYYQRKTKLCSVVVDGFGDRSTASISKINGPYDIKELWDCKYPISLGLFYSAITDFLGFQINEGEYKVMGLSAYGNSKSELAIKTRELIEFDKKTKNICQNMDYFKYHLSPSDSFSENLVKLLGSPRNPFDLLLPESPSFQRYADIARGAQDAVDKILCDIFEHAHYLSNDNEFLFSGGVALNSASLRKIASLPFVHKLIVPPSPGDAGSAIGAAIYAYLKDSNELNPIIKTPPLFPSRSSSKEQLNISSKILSNNFVSITKSVNESVKIMAKLIADGEVLGTVINNAETGPRALGNRSLICDGKNINAVNYLNTVIKNRSPFRPTAPFMRIETAKKFYELQKELINSYEVMGATCSCLKGSDSINFPTTHVDGTARIQILNEDVFFNMLFDELMYYEIDVLANSSLNVSGDPSCYDLIDGLMVCSRTPLKYLLTDFGLIKSKINEIS